ncbi:flagellar hook-associated protein 3, partial [Pseudomonas sp. BAgro211]|nr:flagellar hook-associated protein 3 [Pseudomonas sp. BAgro211]
MRITNAQITALMGGSMNSNSAALGKLMQQMSSGQRILQPSDDPIASVRMLRIQREEASLAQ